MWNSKRCIATAEIAIHFIIRPTAAFALSYDFPPDFGGKGVTYLTIYTVSQNIPPLTCYNRYIHGSIATISGKNAAEKVGNQNVLYFHTSPN